jgi:hypothetical protein
MSEAPLSAKQLQEPSLDAWRELVAWAYRDGADGPHRICEITTHYNAMRRRIAQLESESLDRESLEASLCPEDVGFAEHIPSLLKRIEQLELLFIRQRARHDAELTRKAFLIKAAEERAEAAEKDSQRKQDALRSARETLGILAGGFAGRRIDLSGLIKRIDAAIAGEGK